MDVINSAQKQHKMFPCYSVSCFHVAFVLTWLNVLLGERVFVGCGTVEISVGL